MFITFINISFLCTPFAQITSYKSIKFIQKQQVLNLLFIFIMYKVSFMQYPALSHIRFREVCYVPLSARAPVYSYARCYNSVYL